MALTPRQKEFLDFLYRFVEENSYSPSYEEIATGLDLASLATVHKHVSALETKGYLRRSFNQSRSLELTSKYHDERQQFHPAATSAPPTVVPLLGRIAAGAPVESIAGSEALNFADFTSSGETFALEVRGDSMIDDHICSGDYVLIQKASEARDGEIVVALVGGVETTLKRYYREGEDNVRLQPANSTMQPIYVKAADVQIQGRVLAVLRKYR